MLKENKSQAKILNPAKVSFKSKEKLSYFQTNKN
jgi:hypothetical protein